MFAKLIEGVLVLVLGFGVKWFLQLIGFALDEAVFNSLIAAIASWIVAQLGLEGVKRAAPSLF